jgi:predicted dithiol-disulfide oxidoreductase (DUF899 family)
MSELRYPNESPEYRKARDELLEEEKALVERVKALAEKRRQLPLGGSTTSCMAPAGTTPACHARR